MSTEILQLRVWLENTMQNSIPANDNSLRLEALLRPCLGVANDETGTDEQGDVWIVGDIPAGAFASFSENDIAIRKMDTWYAWAPVEGLRLVVNDVRKVFSSGGWIDDPSIGGGGSDRSTVTAVTSSAGAVTLDYSLGDYFTLALSENVSSWSVINQPGIGKGFTLMVECTQDSTPRTVAKPGTAPGGTFTVPTGSGAKFLIAITSFNNGTTLRSNVSADAYS